MTAPATTASPLTTGERNVLEDAYVIRVFHETGIDSMDRRCVAEWNEFAAYRVDLESRGLIDRERGITDAGLAALRASGHRLPTHDELRAQSTPTRPTKRRAGARQ